MEINNVLAQLGNCSVSSLYDNNYDIDADEGFGVDFTESDVDAAVAKMEKLEKRKKERITEKKDGATLPVYSKPKPKVKAALPTNLFGGVAGYKKTKMVSMDELSKKAEQEIKEYQSRIAPLFERVQGTTNDYKFVSRELMTDFMADYQDSAMLKAKLVKRYVLDTTMNMYDIYKVVMSKLGIDKDDSKVVKAKKCREVNDASEANTLLQKYSRIKKSGYIVSNEAAVGISDLESIIATQVECESKADEGIVQPDGIKEQFTLILTDVDYKLLSKDKVVASVALAENI